MQHWCELLNIIGFIAYAGSSYQSVGCILRYAKLAKLDKG